MQIQVGNKQLEVEVPGELEQLAEIIGDDEKLLELVETFSGSSLYFPQKINREIIHHRMRTEFEELITLPNITRNKVYMILAKRYGKSTRWVRTIVGNSAA